MTYFSLGMKRRTLTAAALLITGALMFPQGAAAQDKVRVGVFPVASSLPLFVAQDRGFFKGLFTESSG